MIIICGFEGLNVRGPLASRQTCSESVALAERYSSSSTRIRPEALAERVEFIVLSCQRESEKRYEGCRERKILALHVTSKLGRITYRSDRGRRLKKGFWN